MPFNYATENVTVTACNFAFCCCGIVEQDLIGTFPTKYNKIVCGQGTLQFMRDKILYKQMSHQWLALHILFKVGYC